MDFDNVPEKVASLLNHCYMEEPEIEKNGQQADPSNSNQQNGPVMDWRRFSTLRRSRAIPAAIVADNKQTKTVALLLQSEQLQA